MAQVAQRGRARVVFHAASKELTIISVEFPDWVPANIANMQRINALLAALTFVAGAYLRGATIEEWSSTVGIPTAEVETAFMHIANYLGSVGITPTFVR